MKETTPPALRPRGPDFAQAAEPTRTPARHALLAACTMLVALSGAAAELRNVRGAYLYTQTFGTGAPILFLHGGLHHFDNTFAAQRETFASYRRVIGVDQRGHGHSPDTVAPFSYREMAEDTAVLIRDLGVAPVDVVGHSDGGNVALLLASTHPELVRRVALSGANLRAPRTPEELKRLAAVPQAQIAERLARFRDGFVEVAPDGTQRWPAFAEKSWKLWLTPRRDRAGGTARRPRPGARHRRRPRPGAA
jgi:pimeloyl-ACP methyl ester carboxylesterase